MILSASHSLLVYVTLKVSNCSAPQPLVWIMKYPWLEVPRFDQYSCEKPIKESHSLAHAKIGSTWLDCDGTDTQRDAQVPRKQCQTFDAYAGMGWRGPHDGPCAHRITSPFSQDLLKIMSCIPVGPNLFQFWEKLSAGQVLCHCACFVSMRCWIWCLPAN